MADYHGLLYNDDVYMNAADDPSSAGSVFTPIDDSSTDITPVPPAPEVPAIIDIPVADDLIRVIDGWNKDMSTEGGQPGTSYTDTPPTEKPEDPAQTTKTIYAQTAIIINDYSQAYLQSLEDAGAVFYAVYTDGTRDEVDISEVVDPHPTIETTATIETEAIARAINQYFWHDTNGAHVTEGTKEHWEAGVLDGFSNWPDNDKYYNLLMNSLGILLRTQLYNLAALSQSGVSFFDGEGNAASNIVASFGKNGIVLRANGRDVLRVTNTGVVFVPLEGNDVSVTMITDDISALSNELANYQASTDQTIQNLQNQIDGVVDTYYEEVDPIYEDVLTDSSDANVTDSSSANIDTHVVTYVMWDWTDEATKALHEGDLYYNIATGHAWRWLYVDNAWQWYRIADSDVAEALEIARNANTLAGSKRRVFTNTPTVPYDVGDLWVKGDSVYYASVAKTAQQAYESSDWRLTATDDTTANTALGKANEALNDLDEDNPNSVIATIKRSYVTTATYTQDQAGINAKLAGIDTTVVSYANGLITQEVTNRNAAISASASSVLSQVSESYQVKGEYATQQGLNTAIANEVTARNAAIQQSASSITSMVSTTYATQQELGTYQQQTSDSITTIIGDMSDLSQSIGDNSVMIDEINEQINNVMSDSTVWYGAYDPVSNDLLTDSSNANVTDSASHTIDVLIFTSYNPAVNWDSDVLRQHHVGDLYFNTVNGHIWRYKYEGGAYSWSYLENTDATTALNNASAASEAAENAQRDAANAQTAAGNATTAANNANTLAASKRRVFTGTPVPPYDIGDLWVKGSSVMYAGVARTSNQSYNASDWTITATDDTNLDAYKNTVATIIRQTSAGVIVAKQGDGIGTLQGASNFDICQISSWSGTTPTLGKVYTRVGALGLSVYDNTGSATTLGNVVAFIGINSSGQPLSRIGKSSAGNVEIGVNSAGNGYIDFYNNGTLLGHIGYGSGMNDSGGTSKAPFWTFGSRNTGTPGNNSMSVGNLNVANGFCAFAAGQKVTSNGRGSAAFGNGLATPYVVNGPIASGDASFACGVGTNEASGIGSFVGGSPYASDRTRTLATREASFAFGQGAQALMPGGAAFGRCTKTRNTEYHYTPQFVCGEWNSVNSNDIFQVGNGTSSTRANAFRVTTSNTAYIGSTSYNSDKRIKTDHGILDYAKATAFVKSLVPHQFEKFGRMELGFFAQDVEKDPNYGDILVEQYEDHGFKDFRSLSYSGLIAPTVATLQMALKKIEALEKKIEELTK